jgi:hypothetical protein
MANKSVSFSFETIVEKEDFKQYARGRGLTLSQFVKFAAYQYRERYPGNKRKKATKPRKVSTDGKEA